MVLSQRVLVEQLISATNADFLAGTQLDQPGVPGVYTIFLASDVADTTVTITMGGRQITNLAAVILRANSEIRENEDPYFQMVSEGLGRPVINVIETTAMACRVRVHFIPARRT